MSWHARWGNKDPFAKPARPGDVFGIFVVTDTTLKPDPHYGLRVRARCSLCGYRRIVVLAQLRHKPPTTHRGCEGKEA